jgi:hypothetical protein
MSCVISAHPVIAANASLNAGNGHDQNRSVNPLVLRSVADAGGGGNARMSYPIIHRDYETRSEVDLKKVGAHAYAEHASTEILVAVWIIEHERRKLSAPIVWHSGAPFPNEVRELIERGCTVAGHNAAFEAAIDTYHAGPRLGWPVRKLSQLECTLARAAVQAGRPRGLPPLQAMSFAVGLRKTSVFVTPCLVRLKNAPPTSANWN